MSFGRIIAFKVGDLSLELAPFTKEESAEFINSEYGRGLQRHSVGRYISRTSAPVLEDEYDWFESIRTSRDRVVWGIWVLNENTGGRELIGNTTLFKIGHIGHSALFKQAESGSLIFRPEYWGKGIASAAHKVRTWYAFEQMGLSAVTSAVIQGNIGSSTALSRSGYTLTHTVRNDIYSDGEIRHIDHFICVNPLDLFWGRWWHGETVPKKFKEARGQALEAIAWAKENATLL